MYSIIHASYTGCSNPVKIYECEQDARDYIARILRLRRAQGYIVETLIAGKRWEVMDREIRAILSDACGTLEIVRNTFECRECGSLHESRERAHLCCEDCNA